MGNSNSRNFNKSFKAAIRENLEPRNISAIRYVSITLSNKNSHWLRSGPSSFSVSSYSSGVGRHSEFPDSSSAAWPGPGGWRFQSSPPRHCSGPGGVWSERRGAPCGHDGWKRWGTWCCEVLHGQARLCRTCGSLSALALALISERLEETQEVRKLKSSWKAKLFKDWFTVLWKTSLTGVRWIFLIWYSADGTNEITVTLNFDPLVSVTLICSGQYCTHFSWIKYDISIAIKLGKTLLERLFENELLYQLCVNHHG